MDRGDRPEADGVAVTALFRRLADRLLGTAFHVLGHREDAREAVQEGFLRCWRRRPEVAAHRNPEAYAFTVVLNAARDLRRRRRVRRTEALPTGEAEPMGVATDPSTAAERREAVARARVAIAALPEEEREVFLLRQNGELTFEAVAESLRIPVGTAKTRMRNALKRLRLALDAAGEASR
jgi:RNA polymerase sigma-70 factor (ECF subfamily)